MQVLIMIIILYWLAQKIEIARKAKRRRDYERMIAAEKAADRLRRERERESAAAERQARREAREAREADRERIRAEKELARIEKEEAKQKNAEKQAETRRRAAETEYEYLKHREKQLRKILDYYADLQEGTTPGSGENIKIERKIMTAEKQYNELARKEVKLRAIVLADLQEDISEIKARAKNRIENQ